MEEIGRDKLTQAIEDYLKAIYELTKEHDRVSTNQIAETLGITPASVTGMVKKMGEMEPALVDYQRHQGVLLTKRGERAALEMLRHHRLLEMYLHEKLGYEWDEVDAEAEMLEHYISEEFEERIAQALGHPSHDPHGDPIPTSDYRMPETSSKTLYETRTGDEALVERVNDSDPLLLRHLRELGLVPQAKFKVLAYSPYDENLTIEIQGQDGKVVLGPSITRQIYVEIEDDRDQEDR